MDKLTKKQAKFVDYYISTNGNATEAARRAGYSKNTVGIIGHENLKKPNIAAAIQRTNDKLASERIADMIEIKEFWTSVVRSDYDEMKDRLKAAEHLTKTYGGFIDKVEHSGNIDSTVDLSGLSESELLNIANNTKPKGK